MVFRQLVAATAGKLDNDDDGLPDDVETTQVPLPTTASETWTNDQVHRYIISGKTNALSPDTDGDLLPDGLELGLTAPLADPARPQTPIPPTDTNGDGIPNFVADFDPPVFNTTDNSSAPAGQDYSYYGSWPYNLNNARTGPDRRLDDRRHQGRHGRRRSERRFGRSHLPAENRRERANAIPRRQWTPDLPGVPQRTGGRHPTGASTPTQTVIAHPPTVYNSSVVDRIRLLSCHRTPNISRPTRTTTTPTADGLSDGSEDVNHNGIVDLAVIDRNRLDASGNFVVLGTFSSANQVVNRAGDLPRPTLLPPCLCPGRQPRQG